MFYGGAARLWGRRTVHQILKENGRGKRTTAWIDMHTGLVPRGHAEKIHTGRAEELPLASQC
jgi:hypothetical protein